MAEGGRKWGGAINMAATAPGTPNPCIREPVGQESESCRGRSLYSSWVTQQRGHTLTLRALVHGAYITN